MTAAREYWRIALWALRVNWFRAALTALGVVIGVASLVAVTAVSDGARAEVAESIRRLGANVVEVDGEIVGVGTRQTARDRTLTPGTSPPSPSSRPSPPPRRTRTSRASRCQRGPGPDHHLARRHHPEYAAIYNQRAADGR